MNEKPRVLFFVLSLNTGGIEIQLLRLTSGLNRQQFDVMVWSAGEWGVVGNLLRERGVAVVERPIAMDSSLAIEETITWLRELNVTIFFSATAIFWPDSLLAKTAGIPYCISQRSTLRSRWDSGNGLSLEEHVRNEDTDAVVVLCRAMEQEVLEAEQVDARRTILIRSAVVVPDSPVANRANLTIGNVANYRRLKGQDELVRALDRIRTKVPEADLLIAGRTGGELLPTIRELELEPFVRFTGEVADTSVLYDEMAVYAQPSHIEGLPGAVLEAMAHGLPVVATPVGGLPELVCDGETGYLVPVGDVAALGDALAELLLDPAKRQRMGLNAREKMRSEYQTPRMVQEYEGLFLRLIGGGAPFAPTGS